MPRKGSRQSPNEPSSEPEPVPAPPGGPYLQEAFFCEKILREADNVVSFIRQVDRLTTAASGPGAPVDMPPTSYTSHIALAFKSGEARGTHEVKIIRESPSGIRDSEPVLAMALFLEGEDRGAGLYGPVAMTFEQEGLYWFDVYVDETLMTRMPFRVIYQRATARAT